MEADFEVIPLRIEPDFVVDARIWPDDNLKVVRKPSNGKCLQVRRQSLRHGCNHRIEKPLRDELGALVQFLFDPRLRTREK